MGEQSPYRLVLSPAGLLRRDALRGVEAHHLQPCVVSLGMFFEEVGVAQLGEVPAGGLAVSGPSLQIRPGD
ncbi:hypothetical protein HEK616_34320 [Streptomyces nigrescens]|uniref:AraC family transcriptional regulator n=1 Tax=Streptomyces nigrescens TaxID=1920 RepID=A0ABM7ZUA6_STRNI|nr:hypothetical protein HEK616_34320 [Streptomyces nigrescens]